MSVIRYANDAKISMKKQHDRTHLRRTSSQILGFLAIACIFSFQWTVTARIVVFRNDKYNTQYGHPGLRLRLTRKGAEHVKNVGVKLLNEQLATLRGFSVSHPFSQPGLQGTIHVNDIQTLAYQPPVASHISFVAPSYMVLALEGIGITLAGRFLGVSGPFQIAGRVNGQLTGLRIGLTTSFRTTPHDGLMAVNVVNCSTSLQHSHFNLDPEGPLSAVVKAFELTINDLIRQRIPDLLCKGLQDIIEKNSPRLFQRLTYAPLSEHFQSLNASSVIEQFIRKFTKGLYIDGRNIADPIVTPDFFETQQRGELRYEDSADAPPPFHPRPMGPEWENSERMLYLYGSDYTLNSLLYHAYQLDKLTIKIEHGTLPELYRGFVRTTCGSMAETNGDFLASICVGKLIPSIAEKFPNTTTKFILLPHDLPEMKFVDGVSSMDLRTRILTYVVDPVTRHDKQILVSSADGIADIMLKAEDGKFSGDLKLRKLMVRLHRSAIGGIDPESIAQLAPLAKTFLGPSLSAGLKQGLPYPLKDTITFIQPKLSLHDGYVRLATDFELGENSLRIKMQEAFERIKQNNAAG